MKKIFFGLMSGLLMLMSLNAAVFAEEVVVEEPVAEEVVAEPAYTPPPEALEGVGGWAVVDPNTGNVHGVIVCTNDVCGPSGSWGGKMPIDYMGCSGCDLRFQTRATDDGNVAGWHGTQTEIDSDGNISQKNDGSVKWNSSDNTFTIENQGVSEDGSKVKRKQKLVPEKTASDGKNLQTGIEDIETTIEVTEEEQKVTLEVTQETLESVESPTEVNYENWRRFQYEAVESAESNLANDVEAALVEDGFLVASEEGSEEVIGEEAVEEEPVAFVKVVRDLTKRVLEFLSGWF